MLNKAKAALILVLALLLAASSAFIFPGASTAKAEPRIGGTVFFGHYEQDNNVLNGREDIEWIVLDVRDGKAFLLSRLCLMSEPYHETWDDVTWETCSLRAYLNSTFISDAFTPSQQAAIQTTTVDNGPSQGNSEWPTTGGNNTWDKVFLLSYAEALSYFPRQGNRGGEASAYLTEEMNRYSTSTKCDWFLRSPGWEQKDAAVIFSTGSFNEYSVSNTSTGIRPAMWVDVQALTGVNEEIKTEYQVGGTVRWGALEQDNFAIDGKEAIEWMILNVREDRALLLSRDVLALHQYHSESRKITWEDSALRAFLNGEFLRGAFTAAEQSAILSVTIENGESQSFNFLSNGGNDTVDRLFLLSYREVKQYLGGKESRVAYATAHAISQGIDQYAGLFMGNHVAAPWWLRSPGQNNLALAMSINGDGDYESRYVHSKYVGIRPAMWVKLDAMRSMRYTPPQRDNRPQQISMSDGPDYAPGWMGRWVMPDEKGTEVNITRNWDGRTLHLEAFFLRMGGIEADIVPGSGQRIEFISDEGAFTGVVSLDSKGDMHLTVDGGEDMNPESVFYDYFLNREFVFTRWVDPAENADAAAAVPTASDWLGHWTMEEGAFIAELFITKGNGDDLNLQLLLDMDESFFLTLHAVDEKTRSFSNSEISGVLTLDKHYRTISMTDAAAAGGYAAEFLEMFPFGMLYDYTDDQTVPEVIMPAITPAPVNQFEGWTGYWMTHDYSLAEMIITDSGSGILHVKAMFLPAADFNATLTPQGDGSMRFASEYESLLGVMTRQADGSLHLTVTGGYAYDDEEASEYHGYYERGFTFYPATYPEMWYQTPSDAVGSNDDWLGDWTILNAAGGSNLRISRVNGGMRVDVTLGQYRFSGVGDLESDSIMTLYSDSFNCMLLLNRKLQRIAMMEVGSDIEGVYEWVNGPYYGVLLYQKAAGFSVTTEESAAISDVNVPPTLTMPVATQPPAAVENTLLPIPGKSNYLQVPVSRVDAASYIVGKNDPTSYAPFRVNDGDEATAYQFSTKTSPVGQAYLIFTFDSPVSLDEMWMKNGFWRVTDGKDQYARNSRVKKMTVFVQYEGSRYFQELKSVTLKDDKERRDWKVIDLLNVQNVTAVRIRIDAIYKGSKYPSDVCISEIMFVQAAGG